jgi:hypothetical protein
MLKFARRRDEWLLFLATFVAFAWFHQGGGWNQNGRFALVRAIVERGTFFIDDYLVYEHAAPPTGLLRVPVRAGQVEYQGNKFALAWQDRQGRQVPIEGHASLAAAMLDIRNIAATADVSYTRGHFSPNKAPGTSFLAVPAYAVLYGIESIFGADPDQWRVLTINAWLAGVLSVGLLSAFGVVLAYRMGQRLTDEDKRAALVAALALGFGSTYFPYATMLYEHNVAAVLMLASWYFAHVARGFERPRRQLVLAGLCAGGAAISSYIMAVAVIFLAAYIVTTRKREDLLWFGAGIAGPFLLICAYNVACFGTPFTTNYHFENPAFTSDRAALGVFQPPSPSVLVMILVSPFRGLFVYAPVLLAGVAGIVWMFRSERQQPDALLATVITIFLLLFNATFNGWAGGWAAGPRYLVPMLPFLAVPIAVAFRRIPRTTLTLLGVSAAFQFAMTAVDAQPPVGAGGLATVPGRPQWTYNALTDYALPLMFQGRPKAMLATQVEVVMRQFDKKLRQAGAPDSVRRDQLGQIRAEILRRIEAQEAEPLYLATVRGPVSANQIGMYEATFHMLFMPATLESNWNSFNAGEFLFPRSLLSLVPLLLIVGLLLRLVWRDTAAERPL